MTERSLPYPAAGAQALALETLSIVCAYRQTVAEYRLTHQHGVVLLHVLLLQEPTSTKPIAAAAHMKPRRVAELLRDLAARDFLERCPSGPDARVARYRVGPEGQAFIARLSKAARSRPISDASRSRGREPRHAIGSLDDRGTHVRLAVSLRTDDVLSIAGRYVAALGQGEGSTFVMQRFGRASQ